jgi:hypothetical protein
VASRSPTSTYPFRTCEEMGRAIRVAQIGTGNVGRHALKRLITEPHYELTGVWVSTDSEAGKDAA